MEDEKMFKKMAAFQIAIASMLVLSAIFMFCKMSIAILLWLVMFYLFDYRNRKYPQEYLNFQGWFNKKMGKDIQPRIINIPKAVKIILTVIMSFIFLCFLAVDLYKPDYQIAYVNKDLSVGTQQYKKYDQIKVDLKSKGEKTIEVNANGKDIGRTELENIVFGGTPEYDEMIAAKQKEQEEKERLLNELEKDINQIFYKVDLEGPLYKFYINPFVWVLLTVDEKENLFKNAAAYASLKTGNKETATSLTVIKSSSNGENLAEFSTFSGIKMK